MKDGRNGDYLPLSLSYTVDQLEGGIRFHPETKYYLDKSFVFISYPLKPELITYTDGVMGFYAPFSYLPQALGISLGKSFSLSPLALMYFGRFFNFFLWLILVYSAIRLTPVAKWLFLFLALSPMSLFQAASLSQDASVNGVAFLSIALILYYAFSQEKKFITNIDILLLLCPLVFLAFSKVVYSCIALLFLIIPANKFSNQKDYFIKFCMMIVPIVIVDIFWSLLIKGILVYVVTGWGYDLNNQFLFIIHNPLEYFLIFLSTIQFKAQFYLYSFIGNLGWLDTYLPESIYYLFIVLLIFLAVFDSKADVIINLQKKMVMATVVLLVTLGIFTSEYLIWNNVGAHLIEGPSGRYFIPVSPLILLLFYQSREIITEQLMNLIKLLLTAILICILFITTQTIFLRYYPISIPINILLGLIVTIAFVMVCASFLIELFSRIKDKKTTVHPGNPAPNILVRTFLKIMLFFGLSLILVFLIGTGSFIGVSQTVVNQSVGEIIAENTAGQTFYSSLPHLEAIDVNLATYARTNTKDINFHLRDSPESTTDIILITINARQIRDNTYIKFKFSPIKNSENRTYYFFIDSPDSLPGDAITAWSSKEDVYPFGTEYINSKRVAGDLSFKVFYASGFFLP